MPRTNPTLTISVLFPEGMRTVPAHYELDTTRALYTGGIGGVAPQKLVPSRMAGYTFFQTTDEEWVAVKG